MRGRFAMNKLPQIIWGRSSLTQEKIRSLKRDGLKEIYVMDVHQTKKVKEENEVIYLSPEGVLAFFKHAPETVHHVLYYIPRRPKRKK